ncbi:MAG: UDP-N-acetylglucosamine 2-epimerase [Methanohalophilus sp.]|nr:MAG: UDP-N-acetylglucosamine 2-epimerase [Methanohalophilus sp.]
MKRKVAVITGTRAEYGIIRPLIKKINSSADLSLQLFVTGLHLLKEYGYTINEIKNDGFDVTATIPMYDGLNKDSTYYGKSLAHAIEGFTLEMSKLKPDIIVLLGDRLEPFAATMAGATLGIPVAHIHGGDKTDSGHIDENIRHSISRFSNIHFVATKGHARRLQKMGEEKWRIFEVGALGLDSIINESSKPIDKLSEKLGINLEEPNIILLFHPVFVEQNSSGKQVHEILEAVAEMNVNTIVIYPNNDAGSENIIKEINLYEGVPNIRIFKNVKHSDYVNLLKYSDAIIGNSSSGIIEAPSFGLPAINIGSRNRGREHAENVVFVNSEKEQVCSAIKKALYDDDFKKNLRNCKNPYGDGTSSDKIISILSKIKIDKNLMQKKITY